ncbi:MAG: ATP-dependent DNA helicase, partial [Nitrospiria bacterium]
VVISTGTKTLQDQLFLKDLPFLSKNLPDRFTFSMMKGKSNYLCLHRLGESLQQPAFEGLEGEADFETVRAWSTKTETGDRAELAALPETAAIWQAVSVKGDACLGANCPAYDRCYLTRMREKAAASDIVVVNHHLFFADLALKDISYGEILPHYDAVIFDEAHLLEEVATQYFGTSVSSHRFEDFVHDAERAFRFSRTGDPNCLEQCRHVLSHTNCFFHLFRKGEERRRLTKKDFSEAVLSAGRDLHQSLDLLNRQINALPSKSEGITHLSERIEPLGADLNLFLTTEKNEEDYVYWSETRKHGVFLYASPLDVSAILHERLFARAIPIILTSATLSSMNRFDFIRERLGIDNVEEAILGTPFDYEKQALIYLPTHLPNPSHPTFSEALSDEIVRILKESEGRAFLLFTSWKNLETVYKNISPRLPYRLLKQGDQPKQSLIDAFRRDVSSVLFGTTSFWQGVDVDGEALSCVIIDKLPFASPADPLIAARIESLARQGKDPFMTFQLPSAVLSLRQGMGRLIRRRDDRGLIAVLDHRITKKEYGRYFLSSLPPSPRTASLETVKTFFRTCPPKPIRASTSSAQTGKC